MKDEKHLTLLLVGCFALSAVVGIALVLKGPGQKKDAGGGGAERDDAAKRFGGLFGGLAGQREGIGLVRIYGTIEAESGEGALGLPAPGGADTLVRKIARMRKNRLVRAIVVRVNSPGGTVAASQEILAELKAARRDGKKVVVSMGDMAASGGYYVACHADRIFADPGTITGSIGVFVGNLNLTGLAQKIGVGMNIIKSGAHKDILSPWRDMTEEEKALLQETVNIVYAQFLDEVSTGRKIPLEELRKVADGRILTGSQAKDARLVDETGGLQDAVRWTWNAAGLKGEPFIVKDYANWWEDMMEQWEYSSRRKVGIEGLLGGDGSAAGSVPVTYLYRPGVAQ